MFESQWDAFAYVDKSGESNGIIITRGAGNGAFVSGLVPQRSTVYVFTQSDPPGEKWEKHACANTKAKVARVKIPSPHKDLNGGSHEILSCLTSRHLYCGYCRKRSSLVSQAEKIANERVPHMNSDKSNTAKWTRAFATAMDALGAALLNGAQSP